MNQTLKNILFILLVLFFVSCSDNKKLDYASDETITLNDTMFPSKNNIDTVTKTEVEPNNIQYNQTDKSRSEQNTILAEGMPEITQLPFGPKGWPDQIKNSNFYLDLIGKDLDTDLPKYSIIYKLPKINNIQYLKLDGPNRYQCENGQPIDSIIKLTKYRYRLPNINKYESYYMCNSHFDKKWDFNSEFINNCGEFVYQEYGYLILYEPRTTFAIVIDIYHVNYIDAVNDRKFYIDKNYTINLIDTGFTDGDEASNGEQTISTTPGKKRTITILNNGEISINEKN